MKAFTTDLEVIPSALDPMVIYCDNTSAIANSWEPRSHKNSKHIKGHFYILREYVKEGDIIICRVHTNQNIVDPLTKPLPRAKHDLYIEAMGVRFL
jgi:hypothetical protein